MENQPVPGFPDIPDMIPVLILFAVVAVLCAGITVFIYLRLWLERRRSKAAAPK